MWCFFRGEIILTVDRIFTEQKNKSKTSLTISAVLIVAGVVLLIVKQLIGGLFVLIGMILAAGLLSRTNDIKKQLRAAGGEEALRAQMSAEQTRDFSDLDLVITPELAVICKPAFKVYALKDMQKFEVGIGPEGVQKAIFLTEADGTRHKIAQVQKGDGRQESFDALYEYIRGYFASR